MADKLSLSGIASLAAIAFLSASCSQIQEPDGFAVGLDEPITKVIRLGSEYDSSSILVKFDRVPDDSMLKDAMTEGVLSVQPLFNSCKGKEELETRFGLDRWYEITLLEDTDVEAIASSLAGLASVQVVEFNNIAQKASDCVTYPYFPTACPTKADGTVSSFNDPALADQWSYNNQGNGAIGGVKGADISVKDVWRELCCGDPDIIVAVVDEGVKYSHPDLKANMWVNQKELNGTPGVDDDGNGYVDDIYGYNFVDNGAIKWGQPGDVSHGTHCAGTISAVNNNGVGVCGVAGGSGNGDGCRIMSAQIFSGNRGGSASISSKAIKYAADNGASVISCSFGYQMAFSSDNAYLNTVGSVEIDAIHYFEASAGNNPVLKDGNIAIFAAGNDEQDFAHYPGAYHDIISVSAYAPDFLPAYYTNYGPGCNIVAPGGEYYLGKDVEKSAILSTFTSENKGSDYGYMQGTSMACPHVSGVVALALSYAKKLDKSFTREEFKQMILASADDIDTRIGAVQQKTYYNNAHSPLPMARYFHKMGTGGIDAWKLMMHIEGIPCLTAETGRKQWLDLSEHFGSASVSLTYLGVEIDDADRQALGLAEDPEIKYGRLYIHPTKTGSGKIRVKAVGGGDMLGGGDNPPGGMELTQEISIISRSFKSENGGWL